MAFRSVRERILQSLAYEISGLVLATPLYAGLFDAPMGQSLVLMIALTVALLIWVPAHNAVFDRVEWRVARRVASDRPHGLRFCHALSLELSSIVVTVPLIMALGGHGLWEAIAVDLGLTLLFAGYAYLFHLLWDRLWPVRLEPDA